jgi:DNA polymerase (family X)
MDNYSIADNFSLLAKLMDIHGENSFKSRTYSIAAFNIEKLPEQLANTPKDRIRTLKGIGESVAAKIIEMLETGNLAILKEWIANTPAGVIEMLNIKGIGPKKINTIWKEMGIESIGELLYACNENRLSLFKGFGGKTQQNVIEAIGFYMQNQGHFLYSQIFEIFPQINSYLQKLFTPEKVRVTGAYRRQELTIEELEFIVMEKNENIKPRFQSAQPPELLEEKENSLLYQLKNGLRLRLFTGVTNRAQALFETTGNPSFTETFRNRFTPDGYTGDETEDDEILFEKAGMIYIPPFLRETPGIIDTCTTNKLPELIQAADIKGLIHSHSNWSDGVNTIEEMARELIRRGFEYLVISDHSRAAAYANGLTEERIREQHRYINTLNESLSPFRIFKSIESDILNDGSLDYPGDVLSSFDLVIASVHSNLKMTEEKAMSRLMRAIENPYTTILGHMTGRLLLSRGGYPVDHKKLIDACATHQVVIELNAHPRRLDIDWKWINHAVSKNVLISIDPDAHSLEGFDDIRFGVFAAQKAGLTKENNLSSYNLKQFEEFIQNRKKMKGI